MCPISAHQYFSASHRIGHHDEKRLSQFDYAYISYHRLNFKTNYKARKKYLFSAISTNIPSRKKANRNASFPDADEKSCPREVYVILVAG